LIIQVIGTLRGGGAERVALTLHKGFKKIGIESKIYVLSNKIDYSIDDKDIVIGADIKNIKADLIITHMQDSSKIVPNSYCVIHSTLSYRIKEKNFFSRLKYKKEIIKTYKNRNIITVSKGVEKDFLTLTTPKTIQTIYNPFDIEEIREKAEEKIDLNFDYIINVGNLTKVKNQALLLKAYSKLDTNLHLVLVGKGNQETNLKNLAKKLGIEKKVHFLGWQSNPYKYIKNAKLFVLSSNVEGFGNVLIESLILNTPVVSTNCPSGPNEILVDELSQFLAKVNNEDDLKEKIELALREYPKIEEKYYKKFDYLNVVKEYLELKNEY
jgi:glycosyltransferase involved in cell wall biosynthesis